MYKELRQLFSIAVKSVKPAQLIKSAIRVDSNKLIVRDRAFLLNHNCYLIGFGKAVYEMAIEVDRIVGDHLKEGILSVPYGYKAGTLSSRISVIEGGKNNLPDENSFDAACQIRQLAEKCDENHLLLVLVSGGGSALLSYPSSPVSLEEKIAVINSLTSVGADIVEVNAVRKALSELKGGKLALVASPATLITFILSDIVGDPLNFIASGPTILPYVSPKEDALSVLEKYRLLEIVPKNVKYVLNAEDKYLSVAKEKPYSVHNIIIGNNLKSLISMREEVNCSESGASIILSNRIVGLVAEVTEVYSKLIEHTCQYLLNGNKTKFLKQINEMGTISHKDTFFNDIVENITNFVNDSQFDFLEQKQLFFMSGGEPTVQIKGNGKGGRNQELSLRVALALHELKNKHEWMSKFDVFFMSGGTDGIDGPTDAAGAIVDSNLIDEAFIHGLNPEFFVRNNDSYSFFSNFKNGNHLIKVGHTGTNVMDVHVIGFSLKESLNG